MRTPLGPGSAGRRHAVRAVRLTLPSHQEISVHGAQSAAPRGGSQGQDARHPEDPRDSALLEDANGTPGLRRPSRPRIVANSHDIAQAESDPVETTFELNDTLYCKASIPPTEEIYLWLGVCREPWGEPV